MCLYWDSAHDLHTISAGHNIWQQMDTSYYYTVPQRSQINCTWVELFTITTLQEYTDLFPVVANIKAKIFPFKCDPIILSKSLKLLKELAYLCIILIPKWELGFSCRLPNYGQEGSHQSHWLEHLQNMHIFSRIYLRVWSQQYKIFRSMYQDSVVDETQWSSKNLLMRYHLD
jgi:hypothetical protein